MPVERTAGGTSVTGDAVGGFRGLVILSALKLWVNSGIRVNRAYTPAAMAAAAGQFTGKTYTTSKAAKSKNGLVQAVKDLEELKAKAEKTVAPLDVLGKVEQLVAETGGPVDIIAVPRNRDQALARGNQG